MEIIENDLANGSTQHTVSAGNIALAIDYYSTLPMDQWTADANKPLTINVSGTLTGDDGQKMYLTKTSVLAQVTGPTGTLPAPEPIADVSTLGVGYPMKAPNTYTQIFVLPALDPAATSIVLSLTYELLLETTPTSGEYARQTASDTLTIAIAAP
ncbi:MAG TPA: hypothetical protein VGP24_13595 [Glaciihabitans sp.]|jgi:hypothetical protein|nr:hypothetical protein [Glaciihabitans sp.]